MTQQSTTGAARRTSREQVRAYGVSLGFLALAAWFLWGPDLDSLPWSEPVSIDRSALASPVFRQRVTDPPAVDIAGLSMKCSECHALFDTVEKPVSELQQHTHIRLEHGINDRCLNCHDREDRNLLVLPGGERIGFDDVPRLCAQCHGPTYRDWERGAHGKSIGAHDPASPARRTLTCTECHDPHAPAFPAIESMPGPRTLRMPAPEASPHHPGADPENPLQRWLSSRPSAPSGADHD